jgi:hypothetical protein
LSRNGATKLPCTHGKWARRFWANSYVLIDVLLAKCFGLIGEFLWNCKWVMGDLRVIFCQGMFQNVPMTYIKIISSSWGFFGKLMKLINRRGEIRSKMSSGCCGQGSIPWLKVENFDVRVTFEVLYIVRLVGSTSIWGFPWVSQNGGTPKESILCKRNFP